MSSQFDRVASAEALGTKCPLILLEYYERRFYATLHSVCTPIHAHVIRLIRFDKRQCRAKV